MSNNENLYVFAVHFYLVCLEENVELLLSARSSSSSCKNFYVAHYSKSIEGINTKHGILAHHDRMQLYGITLKDIILKFCPF